MLNQNKKNQTIRLYLEKYNKYFIILKNQCLFFFVCLIKIFIKIINNATGSTNGNAAAWRGTDGSPLLAVANDIVEYDGTRWNVVFDSSNPSGVQYTTNLTTGIQYRWANNEWLKSYEGLYPEGEWSLVL